jgi:hypothetical protein
VTPLNSSAGDGRVEGVKFLVCQRADVTAKDGNGRTPLHLASQNGHVEVAKFLVEQQADVNMAMPNGWTPLHSATQNGHLEVVKFLVEQQADVTTKDTAGWTPLHSATQNGHLEVVKFLVEQQADVTTKGTARWTPLHLAARNGHLEVVKYLVQTAKEFGSDISTPDTFGETPLHVAIYHSRGEEAKVLIEHGADISVIDGYGKTALDWASRNDALFLQLGKPSYLPTPDAVRVEAVRRSIQRLSEDLLKTKRRRTSPGFYELGHCLLFLGLLDEARVSFQQQIAELDEEGGPVHEVDCDICNASCFGGPRYVCKMCPDFDACSSCMSKYHEVHRDACHDHEFFEISCPPSCNNEGQNIDTISDNVQDWLGRLIERYAERAPSSS